MDVHRIIKMATAIDNVREALKCGSPIIFKQLIDNGFIKIADITVAHISQLKSSQVMMIFPYMPEHIWPEALMQMSGGARPAVLRDPNFRLVQYMDFIMRCIDAGRQTTFDILLEHLRERKIALTEENLSAIIAKIAKKFEFVILSRLVIEKNIPWTDELWTEAKRLFHANQKVPPTNDIDARLNAEKPLREANQLIAKQSEEIAKLMNAAQEKESKILAHEKRIGELVRKVDAHATIIDQQAFEIFKQKEGFSGLFNAQTSQIAKLQAEKDSLKAELESLLKFNFTYRAPNASPSATSATVQPTQWNLPNVITQPVLRARLDILYRADRNMITYLLSIGFIRVEEISIEQWASTDAALDKIEFAIPATVLNPLIELGGSDCRFDMVLQFGPKLANPFETLKKFNYGKGPSMEKYLDLYPITKEQLTEILNKCVERNWSSLMLAIFGHKNAKVKPTAELTHYIKRCTDPKLRTAYKEIQDRQPNEEILTLIANCDQLAKERDQLAKERDQLAKELADLKAAVAGCV